MQYFYCVLIYIKYIDAIQKNELLTCYTACSAGFSSKHLCLICFINCRFFSTNESADSLRQNTTVLDTDRGVGLLSSKKGKKNNACLLLQKFQIVIN